MLGVVRAACYLEEMAAAGGACDSCFPISTNPTNSMAGDKNEWAFDSLLPYIICRKGNTETIMIFPWIQKAGLPLPAARGSRVTQASSPCSISVLRQPEPA